MQENDTFEKLKKIIPDLKEGMTFKEALTVISKHFRNVSKEEKDKIVK